MKIIEIIFFINLLILIQIVELKNKEFQISVLKL